MVDKLAMPVSRDVIEADFERRFERAQSSGPEFRISVERRNDLGIHKQKQDGLQCVGAAVTADCLTVNDIYGLPEIAAEYRSDELRLTTE